MKRELLLSKLKDKFNITQEEISKHKDNYFKFKHNNKIYSDIKTRFVHLGAFWDKDDCFKQRFNLLFKKYSDYEEIIEVGFGLPYLPLYLEEKNKLDTLPNLILIDKFENSKLFSEEIMKFLKIKASILVRDLEKERISNDVNKASKSSNKLLVAIETVEHLRNPEKFWNFAEQIGAKDLIVSLPIRKKIPSHHQVFKTTDSARKYLAKHLYILEEHIFTTNPDDPKRKCMVVYGSLKNNTQNK